MTTNTYATYNMNTMMKIVRAIDSLPDTYALKGESVKSIEMDEDYLLVAVNFLAMRMVRVDIPELELTGWKIDGSNQIFIEKK